MTAEGVTAYIGLGSNIEPRKQRIMDAILVLANVGHVIRVSSVYESSPVGKSDQPAYLNAAVEIRTLLEPHALLDELKDLEGALGRTQRERWHEREIDFDILFYNNEIVNLDHLTIPHPELHKRKFVLEPMLDLAPSLVHPVLGKTIDTLARELDDPSQLVRRL